ncbi:MAG: NAD(+)--rifampin ADP-ribosyltransferase [Nostoc sp. NMS1]|nr:NAD(+)--rifampin ADP-ribosyltransferase [Nostoc sp. NMS1]MBN3992392.1 NAD(+)--rifampin ADP-ribosyltransferase [Nostoc sp. NMS2]
MEFNPNNNVVKLCLQGMGMEEKGKPEEASKLFLQAWNEATHDFEKFISAHYTDKKFPGNPTRSYRSQAPLKIVGEVTDWVRQTPEELQKWREKLANNKGEIIN